MSVHWILCLTALLATPVLNIALGLIRGKGLQPVGAKCGYKTTLSLASDEAWAYAQSACGTRYMVVGLLMGIASVVAMRSVTGMNAMNLYIYSTVLFLTQGLFEILLISSVESELRAKFGKKTEM